MKMKLIRRVILITLAACMSVYIFAGCGKDDGEDNPTGTAGSGQATAGNKTAAIASDTTVAGGTSPAAGIPTDETSAASTNQAAATPTSNIISGATDLMAGLSASIAEGKAADGAFISAAADFSIRIFQNGITGGQNSLMSPTSVLLALAMTTNGASGNTLSQMEKLLGGSIPIDELNKYLYSYVKGLPSTEKARIGIANSIWFRGEENRLTVEQSFLQTNSDYYGAAVFKADFNSLDTVTDINNWVNDKTDGMINKIIEQIDEATVMYLINAVVFDAEWKTIYNINEIGTADFTQADGTKKPVEFMSSEENIYLNDGKATGFIKPYADDSYSFVALLPNENTDIVDYIAYLDGEKFVKIIKGKSVELVRASLPKFSYEYKTVMNDQLKALGMPDAFNPITADFSRLGRSARGNIFIGEVLHKTFIAVDEKGTRAGAVTKVEMQDESYTESKYVKLDRPFVYAIIDNTTSLPVFIGTVMNFD